jgi:hypothetical protein
VGSFWTVDFYSFPFDVFELSLHDAKMFFFLGWVRRLSKLARLDGRERERERFLKESRICRGSAAAFFLQSIAGLSLILHVAPSSEHLAGE